MLFLHLFVDGLVSGCAIGIVAVTFTLIYTTTRVFHLAHAAIYTLAGYAAWYLTEQGVPFAIALLGAVVVCAAVGALVQHQLYNRLVHRGATPLVLLIGSFGATVVIQNVIAATFSPNIRSITTSWGNHTIALGAITLSMAQVLIVVTSLLVFAGLRTWSIHSALGKRIRAVAANDFLADITRLEPLRVHVIVMAVTSGLVAFPGCLVALDHGMQPYSGTLVLLTAIIAMIAGGMGSLVGAFVTAIILSVLQTVSTVVMPGQWSIAATLGLFVVLMIFRPTGLFVQQAR
jgi:branched-chain amino acid transport system permease protein